MFLSVGASAGPDIIGLIGVGKQGQRHLHELSLIPGVQVEAVDLVIDPALRAEYANNKSIELVQGDASLLYEDPRVKSIIIVTRGDTHYDIAKAALLHGKNVLVEKPFTDTEEQARDLVNLAAERGLVLLVGHNRAFLPQLVRMKEMIESGHLGKILEVDGNYLNPHQRYDSTHTALEGLGYHQLYMIQTLLGQNSPDEIKAALRSGDWETNVSMALRYGNVPVRIKLSREYSGPKTRDIVVRGDKFTATFDYSHEPALVTLQVAPTHPEELSNPALMSEFTALKAQTVFSAEEERPSLHHQLLFFLGLLQDQNTGKSNGQEAISTVSTLDNVREELTKSDLFVSKELPPTQIVTSLADIIHRRFGSSGGVVAVDGLNGTGKSTLVKTTTNYL